MKNAVDYMKPNHRSGIRFSIVGFVQLAAILLFAFPINPQAQDVRFGGYLQGLPLWITTEAPAPFPNQDYWEYRIQNRLNLSWYTTDALSFTAQARVRLFAGDLVSDIPGYASTIAHDDGMANLSWMIMENENALLHFMPDRLYAEWSTAEWNIRLGRQRVNWGINMMTNPNDLFNIYSFYEFDYPERPGADAIRLQHFVDWASRFEIAVAPARDIRESVAAALYAFNHNGYDIQFLAGYYQNRAAVGGGWAGSIHETGFKGELMFFQDIDKNSAGKRGNNIVTAVSVDHMFENSLFLIIEGLYNSTGGQSSIDIQGASLSADNPSLSRYQLSTQLSYPFNPLLDGALAVIWYPDEKGYFISPSLSYNVTQNTDIRLLAQHFTGAEDSIFSNRITLAAFSVRWNF